MTDRELLECAAKAAGIEGEFKDHGGVLWLSRNDFGSPWNPITDDGDALRLAVKLGMTIEQWSEGHVYVGHRHPGNFEHEKHGTDPLAATRRAIVRAAAEIGKNVK
jgi:hypothetical protein